MAGAQRGHRAAHGCWVPAAAVLGGSGAAGLAHCWGMSGTWQLLSLARMREEQVL